MGATFGVSTTGVAGPGGGTPQKPVGLVYVGLSGPAGTTAERLMVPGDREQIRGFSASFAIDRIRRALG
jgi:nicotinamide-nucleotide amidase